MNSKKLLIIAFILIVIGGIFLAYTKRKNDSIRNQCKVIAASSYGSGSNTNDLSMDAISQRMGSLSKVYDDCLLSHGLKK